MNFFITGIGTNVGKTIVSAILTEALIADYWKPIQSGISEGKDSTIINTLISNSKTVIHPETYLLTEPLSPHFAAKIDGINIDLSKITLPNGFGCSPENSNNPKKNHLMIEGAGGLLVPLNQKNYVIDIAKQHNCKIILVISNYLGCINHSLLSIHYLIKHGYDVQALVFNGSFETEVKQAILKDIGHCKVIDIPTLAPLNKETVRKTASKLKLDW